MRKYEYINSFLNTWISSLTRNQAAGLPPQNTLPLPYSIFISCPHRKKNCPFSLHLSVPNKYFSLHPNLKSTQTRRRWLQLQTHSLLKVFREVEIVLIILKVSITPEVLQVNWFKTRWQQDLPWLAKKLSLQYIQQSHAASCCAQTINCKDHCKCRSSSKCS